MMDAKIIRSEEQIRDLIVTLRAELDDPLIKYGREDTKEYIRELRYVLENGEPEDEWSEVGYWLCSKHGTLGKDYGIE